MEIGVLDYASGGNIHSVVKAVEKLGYGAKVVKSLKGLDKLIIPGVGSFSNGSLDILPFREEIQEFVKAKPLLGICLGMQLLCQKGFEFGEHEGLGLIDGECVKINTDKPLPHLGWSKVELLKDSKLLTDVDNNMFYFMHSYEVVNYTDSTALSDYESHKFVSVVEKGNIYGVQFHPEKSRDAGLQLLNNFLKRA